MLVIALRGVDISSLTIKLISPVSCATNVLAKVVCKIS